MFNTVAREPNLTGRVTNELERLILDRHLQPGDRLPPVADLASQYGVSRTVIREAIGALAAKGLLEVKHGSGTVVSQPSAANVTQSMTRFLRAGQAQLDYTKVSQVRRVLEVEIAGLAAEQRTPEDLERLEASLREMTSLVNAPEPASVERKAFVRNDIDFHTALAHATHNELFAVVLNSLADILLEVRQRGFELPGTPAYALQAHQAIFEQVKARQPDLAREAMQEHLVLGDGILRRALSQAQDAADSA